MLMDTLEPSQQSQSEALYEFDIYPFTTDPVFQEGLQSIVSSVDGKSPEGLENIIGQAKVFYFARTTGQKVTWENYVEWKKLHPSPFPDTPTAPPGAEASTTGSTRLEERAISAPLSFQQITELIKTGQTHLIPNNKVIPEALHSDAPSESTNPARRKPWEREDGATIPTEPEGNTA